MWQEFVLIYLHLIVQTGFLKGYYGIDIPKLILYLEVKLCIIEDLNDWINIAKCCFKNEMQSWSTLTHK